MDRILDQGIYSTLDLADCAGLEEGREQVGYILVREMGLTDGGQNLTLSVGCSFDRDGHEFGRFPVSEIATDRFADAIGIAEHTEQVIAQLECLADRPPEGVELGEEFLVDATFESRAELERAHDGVERRLEHRHPLSGLS